MQVIVWSCRECGKLEMMPAHGDYIDVYVMRRQKWECEKYCDCRGGFANQTPTLWEAADGDWPLIQRAARFGADPLQMMDQVI